MKKQLSVLMLLAAMLLPWALNAQSTNATVPYSTGFETTDDDGWELINGSVTNKWCIGTAVSNSGSQALYVSNDNGTSNSYTVSASGCCFAVRTFTFSTASQYYIEFDWKSGGESTFDYLRCFLVPENTTLTAGTTLPSGMTATGTPTGWIDLGGKMNLSAGVWMHTFVVFDIPVAGTYKIVFVWRNDTSSGTQGPAAVDNVVVSEVTCPQPTLTLDDASSSSVTVSWNASGSEQGWMYRLDNGAWQSVATPSVTLNGLESDSNYTISVRAICGAADTSLTSTLSFITPCEPMSSSELPYFEGFETTEANSSYSSAGVMPSCWNAWSNGTNENYVPHVVTGTGSYVYRKTGDNSLVLYPGSSSGSNGNTKIVLLPPVNESLSNLYLNFWMCTESATNGYLQVGYVTGADTTGFTPIATYPASSQTLHSGNGLQTSAGMDVELSLASLPSDATRVGFLWYYNGAYGCCIDDVLLGYPPACPVPADLVVTEATANTLDVEWTSSASEFIVEYGVHGFTPGTGRTQTVNSASVTLEGLQMGLTYDIYVTAVCGSDTSSSSLFGTGQTICGTLTSDDLPYTEDFEAYGTGSTQPINACWTKGTNYSTAYPYPYSTAAVNGVRGLYFYGTRSSSATGTSYYSWAALPPIDDELDMSDLMVNFMMKRYSTTTSAYHSMVAVGVADSVTNLSNADALDSLVTWIDTVDITAEAASSIHSAEVSFGGYTGNGKYVVFYAIRPDAASATQYNQFYLDDITLRTIPNCFWPSEVVLNSVTNEGATITWTPDPRTSSPSSWEVEYGEEGFEPGTGNTASVTDTTITLTDLTPNTAYDVYIRANCGGDISDPAVLAFRTLCNPVATDSLPYVEDFESYASGSANGISPCWYKQVIGSTTQYPYPSTTAASSGSIGLYAYSTSSFYSYAVLPMFESSLSDLMIEFDLKRGTSSGSTYHTMVYVGVMTVADDLSTFDTIAFIDDSENPVSSVTHHLVSLEGYEGTGRLALLFPSPASSHYNYAYVDSVVVNQLPACRWPMNVAVDSVGAYEIDLSWTGSASNFEVQVSTTADFTTATTTSTTVSATEAALTGLTPYTQYYLRVRGVCGSDVSFWSEVVPVITSRDCGPNNINIVDTVGDGTSAGYTYTFYGYSTYFQGYNSAIYTVTELNDMGLQVNNRINGIKLHSGTTGGTIRGARIYVAETSLEGYSTTPANDTVDRSTMTLVYSGDLVVPTNSWVEIPFTTPFSYSGNSNLLITFARDTNTTASVTFYYTSASPDYLNCYGYRSSATTANLSATRGYYRPNVVFDICTEIPSCVRPSSVALVSYSDTAASLQWDSTASSYEVALSTSSVNPDSTSGLTTYTVATNNIDLTGLTPNTEYYVYVRSLCGAIGNSEWSVELSFRTACAPQSLPYSEDFESYASGSSNPINPCWTKGTNSTTAYPYPYATNAINGSRSLYFYAYRPSTASTTPVYSYAALPMMADSVKNLMLSFYVRRYGTVTDYYTTRLVVGVMSNPEDITTFESMDTIDLKNAPALSVHGYEYSFANYTGDGRYIAIFDPVPPTYGGNNYSYSYAYVDDILVDHISSCMRPTNVTVSNIGTTTATVHWTHSATNFEVEYGPSGFEHGMGTTLTATGDSIDLTGLLVAAPYDVYVRAFCTASDSSNWSFVQTFYTECGIVTVPYSEDFESYGSGASMTINPCWVKGTNSTTAYPYPYATNAVNGERSLYFYAYHPSSTSSTAYYSYVALPEFNAPVNNLELSFSMRRYTTTGNSYTSYIVVGVMTNPNDINTFVGIDTIDLQAAPASSIHDISVSFASYADTGKYIALYSPVPPLYGTGTYSYSYSYVDDIYVSYIPACPRAYDLTAYNATASTVELAWTDTIGSTQWMVSYAVGNDTNWTEVLTGSNPYVLTGLTANTLYRYRVAPVCSDGNVSDWSREIHYFTTSQVPATVPYNYDFENAAEWANWQTSSNSNVNWYRGNVAQGNTTNAMYISADNGATHSWNMNSVTNAVAYRDIDFGAGVHSFQVDFDAYIGGTIAHNYDGVSVVVTDPATPVESVSTGITSPWGHVNDVGLGTVRHDTAWGSHTIYIDNVSGVKRVAFYHFNQATGNNNAYDDNPSAIDNISITLQPCERPGLLAVNTVTTVSAQLSWIGDTTSSYELCYRVQGAPASTNSYQTVSGTAAVVTGLASATDYYWWVRKICSITPADTLVSAWSVSSTFTTACAPVSVADTLFEDFESYEAVAYNNATDGVLPHCWDSWNNSTAAAPVFAHVTDSGTYSYCVSGRQALTITAGSPTGNYGSDAYVRLRDIVEPTNSLTLTFWMCTESSSNGYLEVGYLTGNDYATDFVALKRINASSATYHSGNGIQPVGHGIYDTVHFDSVPAGNYPLCFHWSYTTSFYSVCIDDLGITTNAAPCDAPVLDVAGAIVTDSSIDLSWTGSAAGYEAVCVPGVWTGIASGIAVSANSYVFGGLTPETDYTVAVRADCGGYYSQWVTYSFTTPRHTCAVPTNIGISDETYDGATVSWAAGEEETEWQVRVFCASPVYDDTIDVSGTPSVVITGLANDAVYSVAVRAVCDPTWMSVWSDTVPLTPVTCPQVTGVGSSNVTFNAATISWNPSGAASYELEYGNTGFQQGSGHTATSNTASFNLTGLEEMTTYDVFVRSVCATGVTSEWSAKYTFTTPENNGIDDVAGSNVTLFPNPASTMVTIRGIEGESTVTVVDLNGREVYKTSANDNLTIDLTGYAKGAYFVRITGERTTAIRKLIVK